jgi:hypothetical protein
MPDAVFFFFRPRELMLFDDVVFVVFHRQQTHDPGLGTSFPHQAIDIIHRSRLLHIHAFLYLLFQQLSCRFIHGVCVGVGSFGQINLRAVDPQKAVRQIPDHGPGFFFVHHIIRQRGYLFGFVGYRSIRPERFENGHLASLVKSSICCTSSHPIRPCASLVDPPIWGDKEIRSCSSVAFSSGSL